MGWYPVVLRRLGRLKQSKNLKQQAVYYDEYHLSAKEWACYSGMGIALCALIAYIFYRNFLVFLLLLPMGLLYPLYKRNNLKDKRLHELKLQFKEGILILVSSLSAGYSVENAFAASTQELNLLYGNEGFITKEFEYIQSQMRMNRPIESVLAELAERSGLDDIKNFAEVFSAAKRSGGELISIMNHTAGTISDKVQVQEEIVTLLAAKQFEQKIMNIIPFLIVMYIDLTSPGFFELMYTTILGRVIMSVCLIMYLLAYALAQRIMKIEV